MVAVPKSVGGNVVNFLELVRWAFKKKTPLKEAESPFKVGGKGLPEVGVGSGIRACGWISDSFEVRGHARVGNKGSGQG
jgi:hypothetical protein